MKHIVQPHHREHLKAIGIPDPPKEIDIPPAEYDEHERNWRRTLPNASPEEIHTKVIAHAAWKRQSPQTMPPVISQPQVHHPPKWERYALLALLALIAILISAKDARCQFSHVNYVNWQAAGSNISGAFFTAPFNINCLSSMTCTVSGNTISIASAAGGTGCTLQGGTNLLLYDTSTACNDITKWSTNGTTTITALATAIFDASAAATFKFKVGAGSTLTANGTSGQPLLSNADGTFTPGDPIVSGPDAVGAAPTKNPVQVGGIFLTTPATLTNNQVGAVQIDNKQNLLINIAGQQLAKLLVTADAITFASPQHTILDSGTLTSITNALPAGSNVIGHVINDSGSTTVVTGNVAVTQADGANTTLGAKADAKSTATDTTAISAMQVLKEISAMEQAPASRAVTNAGTFATQSAITAASGSIASGAIASGAFASGSISDGADVTLGAKADAKSTATDTTAITVMQVLKEISAMAQAPAALPANQSANVAQFGGNNVATGTGAGGVGIPRVTVSNDSVIGLTAGSAVIGHVIDDSGSVTNATLSAETTKVIGTVNQGSAPWSMTFPSAQHTICDSGCGSGGGGVNYMEPMYPGETYTTRLGVTMPSMFSLPSANKNGPNPYTPAYGQMVGGEFSAILPNLTGGQAAPMQLDRYGRALTIISGATSPIPAAVQDASGMKLVLDPCQSYSKQFNSTSTAAGSTVALSGLTGVSGKKIYFCSWNDLNGGTAQTYAVIEGTGATCATGTTAVGGLSGGTAAANGWSLAANGGHTFGSGEAAIAATNTAGDTVCVIFSGANQANFGYSFVVAP